MLFKDRRSAGYELAKKMVHLKDEHPLILALPQGGVPIGYEIAKLLDAPLDTLVVRKIGIPADPEFGVGAIGPGDIIVIDEKAIEFLGLDSNDLDAIRENEIKELDRRMHAYQSGTYIPKNSRFETIVIADDGLATGLTARAAVESVRLAFLPKKIIFAVPICHMLSIQTLFPNIEIICLYQEEDFQSISDYYENFDQVSNDDVVKYLNDANE